MGGSLRVLEKPLVEDALVRPVLVEDDELGAFLGSDEYFAAL